MDREKTGDCVIKEVIGKLIDAFILNMGSFNESGYEDDEFEEELEIDEEHVRKLIDAEEYQVSK